MAGAMKQVLKTLFAIIGVACLLAALVYLLPVGLQGKRNVGSVESISGFPFVGEDGVARINEPLAHADIYLKEPVLAKRLMLAITFNPGNASEIGVGVRENGFWLSYNPVLIWDDSLPRVDQTRFIEIPLTDKFQEPDRSIDLMLFAQTDEGQDTTTINKNSTINWELITISAATKSQAPTIAQLKDYVRSVFKRERAQ